MKVEASAYDKELAEIQSFVLDALGPLTTVIDRHNRYEAPLRYEHREVSLVEAELLGNANVRISCLRRERIVGDVNRALLSTTQGDNNFMDPPPYFLTNEFAKRSKDYVEQVQAMKATVPRDKEKQPFLK